MSNKSKKLCRTCYSDTQMNNASNLFEISIGEVKLSTMYTECTSIQIFANDGLPNVICGLCHTLLLSAYEFRSNCINADQKYRMALAAETDETKPIFLWIPEVDNNEMIKNTETISESMTSLDCEIKQESNVYSPIEKSNYDLKNEENLLIDNHNIVKSPTAKTKTKSTGHTTNKTYKCEICKKIFKTQSNLNRHNKLAHKKKKLFKSTGESILHNTSTFYKIEDESNNEISDNDIKKEENLLNDTINSPTTQAKSENETYKCEICKSTLSTQSSLNRHYKQTHKEKSSKSSKPHKCKVCRRKYSDDEKQLHLHKHKPYKYKWNNKQQYQCDICQRSYSNKVTIKRHLIDHTTNNLPKQPNYHCYECNTNFNSKYLLSAHIPIKHASCLTADKKYKCSYCPKIFSHWYMRTEHMKNHEHGCKYKCSFCDLKFGLRHDFNEHMIDKHDGVRIFACLHCNEKFHSNSALHDHNRIHTDKMQFLCQECGKSFMTKATLSSHIKIHFDKERYACKKCPMKFAIKGRLIAHMDKHSQVKPFECDLCGFKSKRKHIMEGHMLVHSGKRVLLFPCDICSKRFKSNYHLITHFRTHTGERPYKCSHCEKAYTQKSDLNKHLRIHVGENTYQCTECLESFRLKRELVDHTNNHYLEKIAAQN